MIVGKIMPDGRALYVLTDDPSEMDDEVKRRERWILSHVKWAKVFADNAALGYAPGTLEHRNAVDHLASLSEIEVELATRMDAAGV